MSRIHITKDQNKKVRSLLESHCAALKNWMASAVESDDLPRAKGLLADLRAHEKMYHIFVPDDMFRED